MHVFSVTDEVTNKISREILKLIFEESCAYLKVDTIPCKYILS